MSVHDGRGCHLLTRRLVPGPTRASLSSVTGRIFSLMSQVVSDPTASEQAKPLRTWPMWIVLAIQGATLASTFTPSVNNGLRFGAMILGPLVCVLLCLIWLVFASRLATIEKLLTLAVAVLPSIATGLLVERRMAITLWVYGAPMTLAIVFLTHAIARRLSRRHRFGLMTAAMVLMWSMFTLFRLEGFDGAYVPQLSFRWSPKYGSKLEVAPRAVAALSDSAEPDENGTPPVAEWPGFRGASANGIAAGPGSPLDWRMSSPIQRWRRDVGPAWSSFAHASNLLFT